MPGGCTIGSRPIDLHLKGLQAMGARIKQRAGYIEASAEALQGAHIYLDFPSVGCHTKFNDGWNACSWYDYT